MALNLKTDLTEPDCQRYRAGCNFTPQERAVFDLRVQGHSILHIAEQLHMSESYVNRLIRAIKRKIRRFEFVSS